MPPGWFTVERPSVYRTKEVACMTGVSPPLALKPSVTCTLPKIFLLAEFHEMLAQAEILRLLLFPTFTDSNLNQRCLARLKQRKLRSGSERYLFLISIGFGFRKGNYKVFVFFLISISRSMGGKF